MRRVFKQKRQQQLPNWIVLAIGLIVLAFWNWQLVLATAIGATTLILVYLAQDWDWNIILARLQKLLNSPNSSFILAAIAACISIILSYVGLMVWSSIDNHWLAGMAITQSVAILGGLVLLFFQSIDRWQQNSQQNINFLTAQLTSDDELERLIAIKQLAQSLRQGHLPLPQEQAIAQYCQILLGREQAETVRSATLEVLEELKYLP